MSEWCWDWYDESGTENSKIQIEMIGDRKLDDLSNACLNQSASRWWLVFNDNSSEGGESLRIAFRHIAFPDGYSSDLGIRSVTR